MRDSFNLTNYDINNDKFQSLIDEIKTLREENTQIKNQQSKQID